MPSLPNFHAVTLADNLRPLIKNFSLSEPTTSELIEKYLREACGQTEKQDSIRFADLSMFWPPRLIDAARTGQLAVFFGAGLSIPCGIPGWSTLLSNYLELSKEFLNDEELADDPLTVAQIASQKLGQERIQSILREVSANAAKFSINHVLLAALRLPIYITTNYDCLFEAAWNKVNPTGKLQVVVNNADLGKADCQQALREKAGVLFKIHGSADRQDEHLILTRKDYRTHYRANQLFFDEIRRIMSENKVLFLGFSHKDPEISRLVEDIIHAYENRQGGFKSGTMAPHFFSLQFNMREHHPEVFAARGLVALQPPVGVGTTQIEDLRTYGLAISLADLITHKVHRRDPDKGLYEEIARVKEAIANDVSKAIKILEDYSSRALKTIRERDGAPWMDQALVELGSFASQGLYLVDEQGDPIRFSTPETIPHILREVTGGFSKRPYFRQAKSFRGSFVSDGVESRFNGQGTFFYCRPILENDAMQGLLFSACQIGQWQAPVQLAQSYWGKDIAFLIIDSNGVVLLPPMGEFELTDPSEEIEKGKVATKRGANRGYNWSKLLSLSLRDRLIQHIGDSVIPVALDDDVQKLSAELALFSVITEIPSTRWKLALSIPIATKKM